MARSAGTLAVALTANSTPFERTMARAQGQLRNFGKAVKSTAMTLGVAFGASQLIGAFKSLNGEMDSIAKRSSTLRIDAERYQEFAYAARRTGTEIGTVEAGMKRLDMTLAKAVTGEKSAIDAFRALGLDVAEIRKLKPDELFDLVAKSLSEITDPAERSAAQLAIFGKNGAELNNFLRDYLKLGDEARSKGLIFKAEELKAAEELGDAFTDLNTAIKVLVANSGFISWLNNVAKSIQDIARAAAFVASITGDSPDPFVYFFKSVGEAIIGKEDSGLAVSGASAEEIADAAQARKTRIEEAAKRAAKRAEYQAEKATGKEVEKAVKSEKVKEAASDAEGNFSVAALARSLVGGNAPMERTAAATEKLVEKADEQIQLDRKQLEEMFETVPQIYY